MNIIPFLLLYESLFCRDITARGVKERSSLFILSKIGLDTRANLKSAFSLALGYAKGISFKQGEVHMEKWICKTCGTQFPLSEQPPEACPICCDERQYIGYQGQQWTTLAQMQKDGFRNEFKEHEPGLIGIGTTPSFAIGERARQRLHAGVGSGGQQGSVADPA